jgi:4-carboxymuconolactone decarboxylase
MQHEPQLALGSIMTNKRILAGYLLVSRFWSFGWVSHQTTFWWLRMNSITFWHSKHQAVKKNSFLFIGAFLVLATGSVESTPKITMEKEATALQDKAARLKPMPMSEMRDDWIKILERLPGAGLKGTFTPVNVFGTLMYNPKTMGPFLDYWVTSKLEMGFSGREQELIILRMGYHYQCDYVWKHHVPVAKGYGTTEAELEAVKKTPLPSVFSARENALLQLTDELVEHRTISDQAWSKWSGELKKSEMVDLISIVSQYVFFALLNNSIRVEVEEPLRNIPGL